MIKVNFGTEKTPAWRYVQHRMKQMKIELQISLFVVLMLVLILNYG